MTYSQAYSAGQGAHLITSRQFHDAGIDTRRDATDFAEVLMLDGEHYGPAWLCITTQQMHYEGGAPPRPREMFDHLWDSINGKRAPWESNCWVWVLTFEVVK